MSRPSLADLADALAAGIRGAERELLEEQAVHGLDARDEVGLHPLLGESLVAAGYGVHREQRYPRDRGQRRRSVGDRCDLVVTAEGAPLRHPDAIPTLFDPPDAVDLDQACWIEVKVVAQHAPGGSNPRYAATLGRPPRLDVDKLAADRTIRHAALLLIVFVADAAVARHDLTCWEDRVLRRGLAIGTPCRREVPIQDRMGNGVCVLSLYPVTG